MKGRSTWAAPVLMVTLLTFGTSCEPAFRNAALAGAEAAIQALIDNRELMEAYVRDIKKAYSPETHEYKVAEQLYVNAVAANEGYLFAAATAVADETTSGALQQPAAELRAAAAEFLYHATRALDPTIKTRSVKFDRALTVPEEVPKVRLPRRALVKAFGDLAKSTRWASWTDL